MDVAVTEGLRVIEDATCLGCACLCDDIGLVVEAGRIVEARNACPLGRAWYGDGSLMPDEGPTIDGMPAALGPAIGRAAEILAGARSPLVWDLTGSTIEAQRVALAIADRIGASVVLEGDEGAEAVAFARVGRVSATLGEVRDRADLIVYDIGFPVHRFPRLRERYAEGSRGRLVEGRTVVRIVGDEWATQPTAGEVIVRFRGRSPALFHAALRAALGGVEMDPDRLSGIGIDADELDALAGRLRGARYGAWFHAEELATAVEIEAVLGLVRDLNRYTRFVGLRPTTGGPNVEGARAVLAWQAGAAGSVDYATGVPRAVEQGSALGWLRRGEFDAALVLGEGGTIGPESEGLLRQSGELMWMSRIPRIVVGPSPVFSRDVASVVIPTARPGIDEGGTVARFDGVMLPLRPPFPGRRVAQADALRAIERHLCGPEGTSP